MTKPEVKPVLCDGQIYDQIVYRTGMTIDSLIETLQQIQKDWTGKLGICRFNDLLIQDSNGNASALVAISINASRDGCGGFAVIHGAETEDMLED